MVQEHHPQYHPQHGHPPAAKWAALVGDNLHPMPRQKLKAQDILAQAGASGRTLIRDYNQPMDVAIPADSEVDLADGNVFRLADEFDEAASTVPPGAKPKFAFVADDSWEVTLQPTQTAESLRGLFELPDDTDILRDFESPYDQVLPPGTAIQVADGPVFRICIKSITVKVNVTHEVRFTKRHVTGLEFKETAIAQGVPIDVGCVLYRLKREGGLGPAIGDYDRITLLRCDEFRCVAPDDNS